MDSRNGVNQRDPARAAAAWHAQFDDGMNEGERAAFAAWICKSPVHIAEFLRISAIQQELREFGAFEDLDLGALMKEIPRNLEILVASAESGESARPTDPPRSKLATRLVALAASMIAVLGLGWLIAQSGWKPLAKLQSTAGYETGIGEQRSILLSDGSIAELNTRSRMLVRIDAVRRDITLSEGEALFRVAKDERRPFRVLIGATVVQAIGTEFTVRRDDDRAVVTVIDGRVSVGQSEGQKRLMSKGERIVLATSAVANTAPVEHVSANSALAWTTRRLVFDDMPLESVAAEFNRYNTRQIRIEARLHDRGVTGVFNANDPDAFVAFLAGREDLIVTYATTGEIIVRPR